MGDVSKIIHYFIEFNKKPVGMVRFSSKTKKYIDITTLYIEPEYRGKGFGKELLNCMIENAIVKNKIPVTQTSSENIVSRNICEYLGFVKQDDYAFEFIK